MQFLQKRNLSWLPIAYNKFVYPLPQKKIYQKKRGFLRKMHLSKNWIFSFLSKYDAGGERER